MHEFCGSIPKFNYDYPEFLPHLIRKVYEHPLTEPSAKSKLETYCSMFELYFKEDKL